MGHAEVGTRVFPREQLQSTGLPWASTGGFPAKTTRAERMAKGRLRMKQTQLSDRWGQQQWACVWEMLTRKKQSRWGWETRFHCFSFGFKGKMKILHH